MYAPRFHSRNTNGPVPTGCWFAGLPRGSLPWYRCAGRIGSSPLPSRLISPAYGFFRRIVTCSGPLASIDATYLSNVTFVRGSACGAISFSVTTTSCAPNGCPSCQRTPGCRSNVYVSASADTRQLRASTGTARSCGSKPSSPWKIDLAADVLRCDMRRQRVDERRRLRLREQRQRAAAHRRPCGVRREHPRCAAEPGRGPRGGERITAPRRVRRRERRWSGKRAGHHR